MESFIQFITEHAPHAHWYIFIGLLLAGFNIPISIDAVMVISAILASSFVPEHKEILYLTVLSGCMFSAWIAYTIGRIAGDRLTGIKPFSALLKKDRIMKIESFYQKWGIWAFVAGRFIPFGVRNCIFLTSGISKMPFKIFVLRDAIGCFIWTTTIFSLVFMVGQNFDVIWKTLKTFNIILFSAFSVTVISVIWYKLKKKKKTERAL
jgi:membrane-associated protein